MISKKTEKSRAICFSNNKILLCRAINNVNYFLPGGTIEKNESPEDAIVREIAEEIGAKILSIKFIKKHKNIYKTADTNFHETNFIYRIEIDLKDQLPPLSNEVNIDFEWVAIDELKNKILLPRNMMTIILNNY